MGAQSEQCSICLKVSDNVKKLCDFNEKNEQWLVKLQSVVPEVQWHENYRICLQCLTDLDRVYEFRNLCIRLDEERRKVIKLENNIKLEIFTCYHCNDDFDDKSVLTEHIQEHYTDSVSEDRNECYKCGKKYVFKKVLKKHLKICRGGVRQYTDQSPFKCEGCSKVYTTKKILRAHQKLCQPHSDEGKRISFGCELCEDTFESSKLFVEHCINHHGLSRKEVKPHTCDQCPMKFSSSATLIQHKKYHSGSRSHVCSFCGKTYITKSDLTVHEYTHFNRRNYKCDICDKAFNTNKNLRSHILVVHTPSSLWKYGCELCQRRFPLKSGYEQHIRRHTGDKRFTCQVCEKSFISRSELQKHMGYHSKVRPFKCAHCDKCYKEQRVYKVHLKKVHGIGDVKIPVREKKYACHMCPNMFFDKQKLTRHLCGHSGVKPHECTQCDKKFADKYYLKQHLRVEHNLVENVEMART